MALKKTIVNDYGVETTYHKIRDISVRSGEEGLDLVIFTNSYVNEEIREKSTNLAVDSHHFHAIITLAEIEETPIFKLCYDYLKNQEFFKDAEDC